MSCTNASSYERLTSKKGVEDDIELIPEDYGYDVEESDVARTPRRYTIKSKGSLYSKCFTKIVVIWIFAGLVSIGLGFRLFCNLYRPYDQNDTSDDGLVSILGPKVDRRKGFTLISPTFNRTALLPTYLARYATGEIPSLQKIIIIWNNLADRPSNELLTSLSNYKVPIVIEERKRNSLNERFRLSPNIETNCIFAMDDDMFFRPKDIEAGYKAWTAYGLGRKRMVGFIARDVTPDGTYASFGQKYSMVLTKAAFFHTDWMTAYWSEDVAMKGLRAYVDKYQNCEDILMAFLQAKHAQVSPLSIEVAFEDKGTTKGISTTGGHYGRRTACVRKFKKVFGNDTLRPNTMFLKQMKDEVV